MIPRTAPTWQTTNWQKSLAHAIRDPAKLLKILKLPEDLLPAARKAAELFPLRVPHSYVARMQPGDVYDPLLRQVLPLQAEFAAQPDNFTDDPVGDLDAMPIPGLLHKYQGRVLLITTGACAIHCRYCFRRHYPYQEAHNRTEFWQPALDYIQDDETIEEVILSGGDPLSLSNERLAKLFNQLQNIKHINRLRIHSRYPVVLPERIDDGLLGIIASSQLATIMVIHCNHAREINDEIKAVLLKLTQVGCTLLNQAVLLKGINDSVLSLKNLSKSLFEAGVLPYYLHQLDKVTGAAHFGVDDKTALQLERELRQSLPGYLVPKLVTEDAGMPSKLPLGVTMVGAP
jgi:EF-P beta-lysylation protein EpmB